MKDYRSYSLWLDQVGEITPRPPLDGDTTVDVAIVGAGYTGLWTARYLLEADPSLRVAILEKEVAGFGASGRNGGWCSALFSASRDKIAHRYGRPSAIAMQHAMFETIDEVGRALQEDSIDAGFVKGGTLTLVTSPTQLDRVRDELEAERSWGFGDEHFRWLDADATAERIQVEGCLGAIFTPHCARIHPARLARGLADSVKRRGAVIYEGTPVEALEGRKVRTSRGIVTSDVVVRATEGYSVTLPGEKRTVVPLYSLMIATEPLPGPAWEEIDWSGCETIHDGRHLLIYAQRTPDGRIAIGGRGAPYHFGSRISDSFDRDESVFAALERTLVALFPQAAGSRITHRWGGPLGVPRDWFSSVGYDPSTGRAWAGGYVGDGVSTTNLAGRTLADLITGKTSELTRLPWVGHRSRRWEPEPFRWAGINAGLALMGSADRVEERTGRPTTRGARIKRLIGI